MAKYQAFKNFNKRILVATDLFGRGMDIERVNIVVNYDMPEDSDSCLHQVSVNVEIGTFYYVTVGSTFREGLVLKDWPSHSYQKRMMLKY